MADLVSPIVDIISRLWPCCARHTRYLCKLQENKILLMNAMYELKDARYDVQRRVIEAEADPNEPKKRTEQVHVWLQRVQIIEGEVEEILQKTDEQISRARCLGGCCPSNYCWSNYKLGKSIAEKIPMVNELKVNGIFEEVTYRLPPSSVQDMNPESTEGMDPMFDKVWRLVTDKDHKVMGLYGMGGVGKTTLLKKINNEFRNKISSGHDVVMFVVVSKAINYEAIQNKIGERLGLSFQGDDESSKADKIFNQLTEKNFVILLDDIWERVDLKRIGIPQGNSSSKIIFTTRSQRVCGLMEATHKFQVECLPWEKAWRLFQDKVGEEALTSFQGARELAKVVAEECGGLPLALITIGRAMSTTKSVEEWKDAITTLKTSASEFPGMGDQVLPHLKLSYDYLRNDTIKSCFLYSALYPKDWPIDKANLVDRWIEEGLISLEEFDHIDEARNKGYSVIGILKSACLLESGKDEETEVKMHVTIRDLALWIACDCGMTRESRDEILMKQKVLKSIAEIVNAEKMKQKALKSNAERMKQVLMSIAEEEVKILGLYGQGGVGKTTLLKQINNEFLKTLGLDVVIFVVVSKALNIDAIQREIGDRLGLSSPNKTNICNALTMRNFVLLLDDVWEMVDLQSIGVPRPENKSKVIFTTRSETVCAIMDANKKFRVKCLPWDEAWTLFEEKVGIETLYSHSGVSELAKVVARKCGGLPMALITIGRAMSTKKTVQEWNHAITTLRRSASNFPGMSDEVLPLLKLSYDYLPNDTIKYCLCYCAVFPEEWSIDKAELVDRWIREGFILLNEFNHIDEARNYGYDVIGILKSACLLESGKDEETQVKMHGMIRDLALWIEHECGWSNRGIFLIMDTYDLTPPKTLMLYKAERIYLRFTYKGECAEVVPLPPLKSPNLLTLICELGIPEMLLIPHNFFEFMPLLQVLDLSKCEMKTFPASITELLELQHLSLQASHIQELPLELRKLVKLEHLDLSYMKFLKKIPGGVIGSLLELRVLNLYMCSGADYMDIEELYNLKHLNDLAITIKTEHNLNKLLSNRNLQMCTRNLQLAYLCELADMGSQVRDQQYIVGSCFQNLGRIYIHSCNALKNLTWVGYVGNLNSLVVYFCDELEEIITSTDIIVVDDVFSRLKTLKMMGLPKLKSICRNALVFPCLESMEFFECPQLKKLPFDSGSNVNNTLRKIIGEEEWWNELQWEDDVKSKFLPLFRVFCG